MQAVKTPWGMWEVLTESKEYKVKRITIRPGNRLSYQKHAKRKEHWMIVQGKALVTLRGRKKILKPGEAIDIPKGAPHRIGCFGKKATVFIEIQMGTFLGESDIVRLEDDYGRAKK